MKNEDTNLLLTLANFCWEKVICLLPVDYRRVSVFFVVLISALLISACGKNAGASLLSPPSSDLFSTGNASLDSLLQLAAAAPHGTALAKLYYEIGEMYEDNDNEKAKAYYQKMEKLCEYEISKRELEIELQKQIIARVTTQRRLLAAGITVFAIIAALLWQMLRLHHRRNLALVETNATKDKFFSIISHDLKNPAIAQRDAIRTLFDHAVQWDAATLREYYSKLLRSADNHVELLFNLLGWAQLQTKRMTCQPEPFNIEQELRFELTLASKMAEDKDISLITEIPPDTIVTADAGMIVTVVRNLLTNAVKFTPAGGTVTLSVIAPLNGKFTVSVSDTGVGMSDEERQNIFQLDRPHTCRGTSGETGTGLGLIVCRELLEKHGTTLQIESAKGKGSRFWFEL